MRLKSLGCKYFLNFGEWQEIEFGENQRIVSIIGEWINEPKRSNRSGKSSFVEIILYGLYGKSRSKKEIDLINKNFPEEDMLVELVFENNNDIVKIQRGRTASNQIIFELTNFEGADKKVIQDEINKIVGLSYEDFIMTSFFLQGDIHTFMEAGATGQKQVIAKWLEKSYWKDFEKKAKEMQAEVQSSIDKQEIISQDKPDPARNGEIKNDILYLNEKREGLELDLATINKDLDEINNQINKANSISDLEREIKGLKNDIKNLSNDIKDALNENDELNEELPEAIKREEALKNIDDIKIRLDKYKENIKFEDQKVSNLTTEISDIKAEIKSLRNQYKDMNEFDNICPVMKKACSAIDSIENAKADLVEKGKQLAEKQKELQSELSLLKEELNQLKDKRDKLKEQYDEIKIYAKMDSPEDIQRLISSNNEIISSKNNQLDKKNEQLELVVSKLQNLENIDINELNSQKDKTLHTKSVKKNELNDIINNIAQLNAELKQISEKRKKAIAAEEEIKKLKKEMDIYKYVSFMFSKNGIPSNQVEVAFNEIEEEANIILEKINSDITIEFTPDREMKSWEENCLVCNATFPKGYRKIECPDCGAERQKKRKDELNITIMTQGKEMDFNLESGGGKVLISLAIRLAFVRMLQRRLGVNLKLIVFDEVFGMLDETNRSSVFKLLTTVLINEFGFSQIFAISHEEEIRDVIPDMVKIVKHERFSTFNWS